MAVRVTGIGVFASEVPGEIPGFKAREHVPERKHLKVMSRSVRLGVAAVRAALASRPGWEDVPPERRSLFVGATPDGGEPGDLQPAIAASRVGGALDVGLFGEEGVPRVHPLWLVKGLSNNVLGYASAYFDLRGVNGNRCDGRAGGLGAVVDGMRAVAEGRTDLAIVGGADSLVAAADLVDVPVGEGAAFLVLERDGPADAPVLVDGGVSFAPGSGGEAPEIELGAATGVVELGRRLVAGERGFRVEVGDPSGVLGWVLVGSTAPAPPARSRAG